MNQSVVVVGSLNADIIVRVTDLPRPGQTVVGGSLLQAAGGKGANQAVAAARLGAIVRMVGCVGADGFGAMLRDRLASAGVDSTFVSTSEETTGVASIIVNSHLRKRCAAIARADRGGRVGAPEAARAASAQDECSTDRVSMALASRGEISSSVGTLARSVT